MTTGLDPAARRVAWDLVRRVRDMGTTVVLVTHFMEEAERLCDRIAVMDAGRIVAEGAPQKLVTDHAQYVTVVFSTDADGRRVPCRRAARRQGAAARRPRGGARRRRRARPRRLLRSWRTTSRRPTCASSCPRWRTSSSRSPATPWRSERVKVLLKLTWIEIKLLVREPVTLLFSFAFPVLVLVLLGGIFGSQHMKQGAYQGVKMMDWYVPAFMGLVIASIGTISLPVHLSSYRERGVLRRFRASGVSEAALLGSQLLVSLGVALVGALTIAILGHGRLRRRALRRRPPRSRSPTSSASSASPASACCSPRSRPPRARRSRWACCSGSSCCSSRARRRRSTCCRPGWWTSARRCRSTTW